MVKEVRPEKYFSIPPSGGTITLGTGRATIDFRKGNIRIGGGTETNLQERLKADEWIWSIHIRESGGQAVRVWTPEAEKKITVQAYDERDLAFGPIEKLYLEEASSGAIIDIQATTSLDGYFFSGYGVKKKLDDIEGTGFVKDTHSLVNIAGYVDELETGNRLFGIFGPRAPPVSEPLGDAYFVNGSVSSSGDGTAWATAVQTIDEGPGLCQANNNDVIFVKYVAGGYDENANIGGVLVDIANIHIIGLGQLQVEVVNSNAGATAIFTVSVNSVEIAGFYSNESTNTVEFILTSDCNDCWFHDLMLSGGMENGIHIAPSVIGASNNIIENCRFYGMTNDGVEISGTSPQRNYIINCYFEGCGDNAINLNGALVVYNFAIDNIIAGRGVTTTGINIVLGDYNTISGGFVVGCTNLKVDTGTGNRFDLRQLKPEWGSPTQSSYTPPGTGAWSTVFAITINNPGTVAITISTRDAGAGESAVVSVEQTIDGTNWDVIGNAEYDNTDFSLIDDATLAPSATAPKKAHQWVFQADSGTNIRLRTNQAGAAPHILYYNYCIKQQIQQ